MNKAEMNRSTGRHLALKNYAGIVFDLDGTVYRGDDIIAGAVTALNTLQRTQKQIVFVTNKTTGTVEEYCDFLRGGGINLREEQVISSTSVTVEYLSKNFHGKRFYAVAEWPFIHQLMIAGLEYSENPRETDLLVITLDRNCNFHKLEVASRCLESGARFFAANIDTTCPVEEGEIWDAGSTIAALEKRTHRRLENHFGKPSPFMIEHILLKLQLPPEKILLIGDRVETDIAMGKAAGMDTVLVETGVKNYLNGDEMNHPNFILPSIAELTQYL